MQRCRSSQPCPPLSLVQYCARPAGELQDESTSYVPEWAETFCPQTPELQPRGNAFAAAEGARAFPFPADPGPESIGVPVLDAAHAIEDRFDGGYYTDPNAGTTNQEEPTPAVQANGGFNCSTFVSAAAAEAGLDTRTEDDQGYDLSDYINITSISSEDFTDAVADGDPAVRGSATGLPATGQGLPVDASRVRPGDMLQVGGHASIADRVLCEGSAIFGAEGSPEYSGAVETFLKERDETPDLPAPPVGLAADARYWIDDATDPAAVVDCRVAAVEHLGAHSPTLASEGGIYTKPAKALPDPAWAGRPSNSPWYPELLPAPGPEVEEEPGESPVEWPLAEDDESAMEPEVDLPADETLLEPE